VSDQRKAEIEQKLTQLKVKLIKQLDDQVKKVLDKLKTDTAKLTIRDLKAIDDDIVIFVSNFANDEIFEEMDGCVEDIMQYIADQADHDLGEV